MTAAELEKALKDQDETRTIPPEAVAVAQYIGPECDTCGEMVLAGEAFVIESDTVTCADCALRRKPK